MMKIFVIIMDVMLWLVVVEIRVNVVINMMLVTRNMVVQPSVGSIYVNQLGEMEDRIFIQLIFVFRGRLSKLQFSSDGMCCQIESWSKFMLYGTKLWSTTTLIAPQFSSISNICHNILTK